MKLKILHRDPEIIVVHKPGGMTVYEEQGAAENATSVLEQMLGIKVFPVHRIDRGTCGVLIFALNARWSTQLRKSFFDRRVKKTYLALVIGIPPDTGSIKTPLKSREGKEETALTRFTTLETFELAPEIPYSLVKVEPRTGRFHQIRKHFRSIGHPLLGDEQYGTEEINALVAKKFKVKRPLLNAFEITFPHPRSGRMIHVSTDPDPDFSRLCP
ncbi:MAG: RluA family pseudouridine synthase [Methylotenera sp.]|nr:RluA family pseudouridine synthase [Oligoflexia bacterium]